MHSAQHNPSDRDIFFYRNHRWKRIDLVLQVFEKLPRIEDALGTARAARRLRGSEQELRPEHGVRRRSYRELLPRSGLEAVPPLRRVVRGKRRRVAMHALQIHGRREQLERRRRPPAVQHQQAVVVVRIYLLQLLARRRVEEADPERVPRRGARLLLELVLAGDGVHAYGRFLEEGGRDEDAAQRADCSREIVFDGDSECSGEVVKGLYSGIRDGIYIPQDSVQVVCGFGDGDDGYFFVGATLFRGQRKHVVKKGGGSSQDALVDMKFS